MAFNAWDHVDVDDEYMQFAHEQFEKQRSKPVSDFDKKRFMSEPSKWYFSASFTLESASISQAKLTPRSLLARQVGCVLQEQPRKFLQRP